MLFLHLSHNSAYLRTCLFYFIYSREKLHEGVIKDVQRQQRRKAENIYMLQQQIDLTKQLKSTTETTNR